MKSLRSEQNTYLVKSKFNNFWDKYKLLIISLFIVFVVGVLTGIFTVSRYSSSIDISNIPDSSLVSFIEGDKTSFGLFVSYFLLYGVLFGVVVIFNSSIVFVVIDYIIIFVLGYRFGFIISAFITLFSFLGAINVILVIVPCQLLLAAVLIVTCAVAICRFKNFKKYGCNVGSINYLKIYCALLIVMLLIVVMQCLLAPIIRVTIIV